MNYITVGGTTIDELMGADVLEISLPKMAEKKDDTKTLWGRDGYVNGIENAFQDEDITVIILCENANARKTVLDKFSTALKEIVVQLKSKKYYRVGKVISHQLEWVSMDSTVHEITLKLQPFYFIIKDLGQLSLGRGNYKNESDISALIRLEIYDYVGKVDLVVDGVTLGKLDLTKDGLVVDGFRKEITYLSGSSTGKPAGSKLIGAEWIYAPGTNANTTAYRYVKGNNWRFPYIPSKQEKDKLTSFGVVSSENNLPPVNIKVKATIYERYLLPYDIYEGMEV